MRIAAGAASTTNTAGKMNSEAYDPPELWSARRDHWASMRLGADSENVLLVRGRAA